MSNDGKSQRPGKSAQRTAAQEINWQNIDQRLKLPCCGLGPLQ